MLSRYFQSSNCYKYIYTHLQDSGGERPECGQRGNCYETFPPYPFLSHHKARPYPTSAITNRQRSSLSNHTTLNTRVVLHEARFPGPVLPRITSVRQRSIVHQRGNLALPDDELYREALLGVPTNVAVT